MMRVITGICAFIVFLGLTGLGVGLYGFYYFGKDLPDYTQLAQYEPAVSTRVHGGDGRMLAEYAIERRIFVPIDAIPERVVNAFLSAEDKSFYEHPGIDFTSILGAMIRNVELYRQGRRMTGASTITQQVAKNFLLTNEYKFTRKIKEMILAMRIERVFDKRQILELYLNDIFLGNGYGVAAAALGYFDKSLDELTIAEAAYLAALPKAPSNYHPIRQHKAAVERRNWVIGRLAEDGRITEEEATEAQATPLEVVTRQRGRDQIVSAYFAEEIRRELADRYGEDGLYKGGLYVHATLDPRLQDIAAQAIHKGLTEYDRRHGWRGPLAEIDPAGSWGGQLADHVPDGAPLEWVPAVVLSFEKNRLTAIGLNDGTRGTIPFAELQWARPWEKDQRLGAEVRKPEDVLKPGDVVLVEAVTEAAASGGKDPKPYPENSYALRQIPAVEGAIVAMDPHTGRVLAMQGGFSADRSEFNRATQAKRQPGSAFKPFVYLAALEEGYAPTTIIDDAPFVIDQGPGLPKWRPSNYSNKFYGPSTMRLGVEKSRNLMTVRLAQNLGMEKVVDIAARFGIIQDMPPALSMSLGAGETTLLDLTNAYAMIVNGGKKISPTFIDRIQDRHGRTIYRHDVRVCQGCDSTDWHSLPSVSDNREQVTDPQSAYQMVSILQGVVQRGTGARLSRLGIPLAGKTGTTNDSYDAWFMGFSADLAVGAFVGFDQPRTLGRREQGASAALPIFMEFMKEAAKIRPAAPFRVPPQISLARVDRETGKPSHGSGKDVILEAFKVGNVPQPGDPVPRIGAGVT
ncbi:MAG: penicillin-binding protein 1A, partial [Magnetospiraceae bacterium]